MTKRNDPKGGGGGGFGKKTDETKDIQQVNDKGKDIKPGEKRTQRIMLKLNPPESTPRITLRSKHGEPSKAPSKPERSPARDTMSTPTRSPHTTLRSRAGEVHFSRRAPTTLIKVPSDLVHSKDESQTISSQFPPEANVTSPSRNIEPAEHADFEHLSDASMVTGPNAFLVKVLSEENSLHEDRGADWELVAYPRPTTPTTVSIRTGRESTRTGDTFTKSHTATTKTAQPSMESGPRSSREKSEEDLESRIRSILTEPNRAQRRADIKSQGSVKSVKWDPSIISLGPVASPEATSVKLKQPEARSNRQSLDDSLKEFTNTVKDLKKSDRRLLAELLEALRNVGSDDDSSTDLMDEKDKPDTIANTLDIPMTTRDGLTNRESSSKALPPKTSESKSHGSFPKATSANDQQKHRDASTSGSVVSTGSTQPIRERSKSLSSDATTLVDSDDTCIKTNKAPGPYATTKLNPRAPVFAGFGQKKHKAIRSDPVEEVDPFITATHKRHSSCDDDYGSLKQAIPTVAKVEKYVPPALRRDRKLQLQEKSSQEPVWVRMQPTQSPSKLPGSGVQEFGGFEKIKTFDNYYHQGHQGRDGPGPDSGLTEEQNQTEWMNQWLRDAARPDHGPGVHSGDLQPAIPQFELQGPSYAQDFAWATQMHPDTTAKANDLLGPLPMEWASNPFNHMQYLNLPAEYYPIRPLPIAGPLIPIPPPPYLSHPFLPVPAPMPLPAPLMPESTVSKAHNFSGGKAGRIAKPLESAWADRVLGNFMSKFPMTGKSQSTFPVPPIQELDTKAAQIQQKLELLILKQKEKKAYERRSRGSSERVSNVRNPSWSTQSTNLISFD